MCGVCVIRPKQIEFVELIFCDSDGSPESQQFSHNCQKIGHAEICFETVKMNFPVKLSGHQI